MPAVTIEPISLQFAAAAQALASDPRIGATSNVPSPYPPGRATTWIRHVMQEMASGTETTFAVLADRTFVGVCSVLNIGGAPRSGELGYWIGVPFWGRGYASAAARLVVDHGFVEHDLASIVSSCLETNAASFRVLVKTGFRHTGVACFPQLKWGPDARFATFVLTRDEWRSRNRSTDSPIPIRP